MRAPPAFVLGGRCSQPAGPTRRGGTTRGEPLFTPLRGRPRPSETETPRLPQSSSNGAFPGPRRSASHPRGARRSAPKGTRTRPPETRLSNPPSVASAPPATRKNSCETGPGARTHGNTPSTRLRGSADSGRPSQCTLSGHRAEGASAPAVRRPRHAPGPGDRAVSPGRNRRPTWLILPVAYACLKD